VREVAQTLRVTRATVYKLCEMGKLPHRRVANAIRIKPNDLALLAAPRRSPG
jgi:excisionase family DNA binding protein